MRKLEVKNLPNSVSMGLELDSLSPSRIAQSAGMPRSEHRILEFRTQVNQPFHVMFFDAISKGDKIGVLEEILAREP